MLARAALLALCLFASVQAACGRTGPAGAPSHPNVLLVTIDTFRADRIGAGVAPAIDRLATSGIRFTAARTAVPLTLPSHATIHTGLLPPVHGVRENGAGPLAESHQTLARLLKGAGYDTAAFVGAFVLDRRFGLAQGFDTYDDQIPRDPDATERLEAERPASAVVDRALAWLDRQPKPAHPASPTLPGPPALPGPALPGPPVLAAGAFFLWIHLYDPHAPYDPPAEFRARAKTPYDGEIAYADSQVARVLDALHARGELDRTLVVVAGDHGEGLGDHGERTHGMLLYDSTLRVPLVIASPGQPPRTVGDAVSLSEVAPTILRAAGVKPPEVMRGRDLITVQLKPDTPYAIAASAPAGRANGAAGPSDLYSETEYPRVAGWMPLQALTDGRWKTIRAGPSAEVYDLQNDPREEQDVAGTQAAIAAAMTSRAEGIHGAAAASQPRAISADAQERLRALGYVAGSTQSAPSSGAPNPADKIAAWNEFEDALSALAAHVPASVIALRRLATKNPDAPVIQTTLARALKDAGDLQGALTKYREAARRWPTDATLLHDLAVAARDGANRATGAAAQAMRDEATRADQAALALEPTSPTALNGLGLLAVDSDRPADAVSSFERATAIDPNNASYWTNLGNARRAIGDRARAEQAYRRALDVDTRAADAANGLGVLLVEANRPADAAPWFERALAAAPDLVEARLNLGIALQQAGDPKRAAAAYRRVLNAPARYTRERAAAAKLLAALGAAR